MILITYYSYNCELMHETRRENVQDKIRKYYNIIEFYSLILENNKRS